MRILSIHNRYLIRGGEDQSRELEEKLLQEQGNQVDIYEENNNRVAEIGKVRVAIRTVWSTESYQIVRQKLTENSYNIVHVQNFFPLISPSVYYAANKQGVPIIQTLRNYRLLCANSYFFRDQKVCEDCLGKIIPWPGVVHGCYRDSKLGSLVVVTMQTLHRAISTWKKMVNLYITLTDFTRQKFIQAGLPADKIVVKPNFVYPDPGMGEGNGNYAIFIGRLSPEKGLDTLLAAWQLLGGKIPLKIIGDGPLSNQVREAVTKLPYVKWLGRLPIQEVYTLIGEAKFLIFPSQWYETFGRVAIEAFAKGTPVIASNLGNMSSMIESGRTGFHFSPGDPNDLVALVEYALTHPEKLRKMRFEARSEFEAKYTAQQNYHKLMDIYKLAIASKN
ncbi:MAG: glycosyltransferase [Trichodesmium sp. St17_bin3_1_1]|nr:glycosyltransferase [Trichodesmium sp. St17_bin3_1_1]MDE5122321.1 glycosyltransferase [Trichodesmium sp. St19_bin1]